MEAEVQDLWEKYFCRASSGWAEAITPEMYSAILRYQPIPVAPQIVKEGRKIFYKTGHYDVNSVADHIDNPEKCVQNPYVSQAMLDVRKNDVPWIEQIINGRTQNYDRVMKIIDDGAKEIQPTNHCYRPEEILNVMDAILAQ
jgi:hypothetical protein